MEVINIYRHNLFSTCSQSISLSSSHTDFCFLLEVPACCSFDFVLTRFFFPSSNASLLLDASETFEASDSPKSLVSWFKVVPFNCSPFSSLSCLSLQEVICVAGMCRGEIKRWRFSAEMLTDWSPRLFSVFVAFAQYCLLHEFPIIINPNVYSILTDVTTNQSFNRIPGNNKRQNSWNKIFSSKFFYC